MGKGSLSSVGQPLVGGPCSKYNPQFMLMQTTLIKHSGTHNPHPSQDVETGGDVLERESS